MSYTTKFHFLDPLHATGNKIDGYLQILCRTAAPLAALPAEQLSEPINAQIDSVARRKREADGFHLSRMKTHVAFTERCLDELASWDRKLVCWRLEAAIIQS
jgi:hypothetical protein